MSAYQIVIFHRDYARAEGLAAASPGRAEARPSGGAA